MLIELKTEELVTIVNALGKSLNALADDLKQSLKQANAVGYICSNQFAVFMNLCGNIKLTGESILKLLPHLPPGEAVERLRKYVQDSTEAVDVILDKMDVEIEYEVPGDNDGNRVSDYSISDK